MQLKVSSRGVRLVAIPRDVISLDVLFDGVRVWSIEVLKLDDPANAFLEWPEPLRPYLQGKSTVALRDSASQRTLAEAEHSFSDTGSAVSVVDDRGNRLAINKWGRLGKTLDGVDEAFQDRITARTVEIVGELQALGLRPFVVGGTLLGGVRDGTLLPHDDDADVAYLSEYTNPVDVAAEGLRVGHALTASGHYIVRHSATHMQLYFFAPDGDVDHYVDVFSAFYTEDGFLNQPFHVRGQLSMDQMLPFGTVSIRGVSFPSPRDPDAWLEINYDENWRTPIPGYKLETPRSTQRRFQNWFGSYNFHRDFWNEYYSRERPAAWNIAADWIRAQLEDSGSRTVVDLGAGDGAHTAQMAASWSDRRIIGVDYSYRAQKLSAEHDLSNLSFVHLNLYRLRSLGFTQLFDIQGAFDLSMNHFLEQVGAVARTNAWRLIRMSLSAGGRAVGTVYTKPAPDVKYQDPTGWHLTPHQLVTEAASFGISVEFQDLVVVGDMSTGRAPVGLVFSMADNDIDSPRERPSMRDRVRQVLRRAFLSADASELEELKQRIVELERDLDGYRRDSLRVAELLDLAEQTFAPSPVRTSTDGKLPYSE
ncbi:hypothetical protein GCM10020360_26720 [Nonlabens tegetincola]